MRLALLALALLTTDLLAQDSSFRRAPKPLCWRGYDGTRCKTYLLIELAVERPIVTTTTTVGNDNTFFEHADDYEARGTLTIGLARNLDARRSLGLVALIDLGEGFAGIDARHRRWIGTTQNAWELSAGYARRPFYSRETCCYVEAMGHGVRGGVAHVFNPYLTVFTRAELLRGEGSWLSAWTAGASANSTASFVAGASALAILMIGFAMVGPNY